MKMGALLKRIASFPSGEEENDARQCFRSKGVVLMLAAIPLFLVSFSSLALNARWTSEIRSTGTSTTSKPTSASSSADDKSRGSLIKLRRQLEPGQEEGFNRSQPIYVDIGLNDGKDTALYLSRGYSVVSVDAFPAWVDKAKEKHSREITEGNLLAFNVGLGTEEAEAMPLYFKRNGSAVASFSRQKGCSNLPPRSPKCYHIDIEVVRCDSLLQLIDASADIVKVDIEMLHHACVRAISRLETRLLPKQVCWEEHDKAFGPAKIRRPITDAKLILGLYENGYDQIKVVMQGPKAARYYGVDPGVAGFGSGSGKLTPDQMMHYRSCDYNEDGKFNTNWVSVEQVFREGLYGPAKNAQPHFFKNSVYFDVCMKLGPDVERKRDLLQHPGSFPLASYATS